MKTPSWIEDAASYAVDTSQRLVLFADILRERGNGYLEHVREGLPPVLVFDYEIVIDGRSFDERPVNYALARVIPEPGWTVDPAKRPIVVIDPRAGHGPGIGGSKRDSELGMAMRAGRPAYFVLFFPEPVAGQTLADVERAEVIFLQRVTADHPQAPPPAVIGNCQAGWASAFIGADHPETTGPLVLAGSPLSYWAGADGVNPMRYRGGLLGGSWVASLLADLGGGKFDGAHLVSGFEHLNPANTLWKKQFHVYENVDSERERFLEFERWWGGFYFMTAEEIRYIVANLFVGNRLREGTMELDSGRRIDLRRIDDPVVVFSSKGDNITPPAQALDWIEDAFGSEDEIRRQGKVIVYLVHNSIGHLGIFVSGSIAKKEHREIIDSVDSVDLLPPGLYEMVIEESADPLTMRDYRVRFEARTMDDIRALDDGRQDERVFERIARVSRAADEAYRRWLSPGIRPLVSPPLAEAIRQLHPLRVQRYLWSDLNPWTWPLKILAPAARTHRRTVDRRVNPYARIERALAASIESSLDAYRDWRDKVIESWVKLCYGNPWLGMLLDEPRDPQTEPAAAPSPGKTAPLPAAAPPLDPRSGGLAEAAVRIAIAVAGADRIYDRRELEAEHAAFAAHPQLAALEGDALKRVIREQTQILAADVELAIATLADLLPDEASRATALAIARQVATADGEIGPEEQARLERFDSILLR